MNNEELIPFEKMSSNEQRVFLENILKQIQALNRENIISGRYEVMDLSYNKMEDGNIVYDVTIVDPDNPSKTLHEYYSENYMHELGIVNLPDKEQLLHYRSLGADTSMLEDYIRELKSSSKDPNAPSLARLEKQNKELEYDASKLGISKEDIAYYTKIDANNELKIDADKISGIQSQDIKSNDFVTTHYTMNNVLGMNCVSYKFIIQNDGNISIYGVTPENTLVPVDYNKIEMVSKNQKSMTLVRSDGKVDNVGIVAGFRIKDSASEVNRDQVIGLCNDNGNIHSFYARGYMESDKLIGEEIPSNTYSNYTARTRDLLDTRSNASIATEANAASARTENGRNASIDDMKSGGNSLNTQNDIDEEASRIVYDNEYIEDKDELMDKFYEKAKEDEVRKIRY